MKVKAIHFVPSVPGLPVYEMENGDIRMPFIDIDKKNANAWWTQAEVMATVKDRSIELRFRNAFQLVKKQIRDAMNAAGDQEEEINFVPMSATKGEA
jgi:hypothetical protein